MSFHGNVNEAAEAAEVTASLWFLPQDRVNHQNIDFVTTPTSNLNLPKFYPKLVA